MASFIQADIRGWHPKPGDEVTGSYGKHTLRGRVMPATKSSRRPAIFSRGNFVACYIELQGGRKVAVNEMRPVNYRRKS